jgi:hypothetical protein
MSFTIMVTCDLFNAISHILIIYAICDLKLVTETNLCFSYNF